MSCTFDFCFWLVTNTERQHLVAGFELDYAPANRFHMAGYIMPEPSWFRDRWFPQPEQYAKDVRQAVQFAVIHPR